MVRSVLMISPQFRPEVGGYERAAERLSGALARAGLRVVVATERRQRAWPAHERLDGFEVRRLPCLYRRRLHALTSLPAFAAFLLRHGREFDVWHVHQYGQHAGLAIALGRVLDRPVVLKLTSSAAMGIGAHVGDASPVTAALHRRVDACVAVSAETCAEALAFGIARERVHLIPNGIDGARFAPPTAATRAEARRALGFEGERVVLYVGRLSPEKNVAGLIEAWRLVAAAHQGRARLVLVGDGPERVAIARAVAEARVAAPIDLVGRRDDVERWYRAADVFVLPSHLEGLSNTMLEAMASGLPVVSTRVSGSSVLVEAPASGVVVEPDDPAAMAAALRTLIERDDLRRELGASARRRFEARFSIDAVATRTLALYERLAPAPARREAA